MHLLGISILMVSLLYANLASDFSHSDYYYDYYYEQERTDEPVSVSKNDQSCFEVKLFVSSTDLHSIGETAAAFISLLIVVIRVFI